MSDKTQSEHEAGGHGHSRWLAHHFDTPQQQFFSVKLGMWIFLAAEVLFFGGLFLAYAASRYLYPDSFQQAHAHLSVTLGGIATVVLISSSLTLALALRSAQRGEQRGQLRMLLASLLLGAVFLLLRYVEHSQLSQAGLLPGRTFDAAAGAHLFFGVHFLMSSLHALHLIAGMIAVLWIYRRARQGLYGPEYHTPVENIGLYWHLLSLIWIFLFTLFYLVS